MLPESSVTIQPVLVLIPPLTVIDPDGMKSDTPSPTQNSNGPPANVAAVGSNLFTFIGLDKA
jgi:hypothetical protein